MRRLARAPSPALVLGMIAVAIAAAGGAYAATSGSGAITVCVHHNGGGLYKATKCARHDKQLSWNKQGPTGPRGIQGPVGPSHAYFKGASATGSTSVSVPAGDYIVYGQAGLQAGASAETGAACVLSTSLGSVTSDSNIGVSFPASAKAEVSVQGVAHVPAPSSITNSCYFNTSGTTFTQSSVLAIKVGTASP